MIKEFDGSLKMADELLLIDSESFQDIPYTSEILCEKIKKNDHYKVYVYYEDDIPVAYLGLLYVSNLHYDGMWVDLIGVRKDFQNRAIGKKLLKYAEEKARDNGLEILTGLVKSDNISSLTMFKGAEFKYDEMGFKLFMKDIEKK
ncbi:GNAT family N-acetyltransferase [Fusobacterium varium]|uniref:GNAT family N-acetyltransferase n=1 Tax=Fusobacterium TaxID=848 RepID=UPI0015A06043